jgi:phosphoribosylanthranilate isomerase
MEQSNVQPAGEHNSNFKGRVKVCGMTKIDQLHQLGDIGVQFAGMIFYPKSSRYVLSHLKGEEVRKEKLKVFKIGVFVNASYEEIMKQVDNFGLDMVQLHGDETPFLCEKVSGNVSVIKAFRFEANTNMEWIMKDYYADSDMFLFDSSSTVYGGSGKKFNWVQLTGKTIDKPFFLGGGIAPGDAPLIKKFAEDRVAKDLFAVDINSCFETAPGVKDLAAVEQFVKELHDE